MENTSHNFSFFWNNLELPICIFGIPHKMIMVDHQLSPLKLLPNTPANIFTGIPAFLLCLTAENGEQNLTSAIQRIDMLLFKIHCNVPTFQIAYCSKKVNCIPRKATNRLCQNQIYLSILTILNHL